MYTVVRTNARTVRRTDILVDLTFRVLSSDIVDPRVGDVSAHAHHTRLEFRSCCSGEMGSALTRLRYSLKYHAHMISKQTPSGRTGKLAEGVPCWLEHCKIEQVGGAHCY